MTAVPMFESGGMWWPSMPTTAELPGLYIRSANDMTMAMSHVKKFDVAVQAGGHCGEWAIWLAQRGFGAVYTFEPDAWNFSCLTRNVSNHSNIFAARGFLGDVRGPIDLYRSSEVSLGGSHHGLKQSGLIPVYRIDDLGLPSCDALILDVEGMEFQVLKGAVETVRKFSPVIQIESHAPFEQYGWGGYADVQALLPDYVEVGRINFDVVLVKR